MLRNRLISGTEALQALQLTLKSKLPRGWQIVTNDISSPPFDAVFALLTPEGTMGELAFFTRNTFEPRHLVEVEQAVRCGDGNTNVVVVAPYIGPEARRKLADIGFGYADSTGNLRIVMAKPAVFIEAAGASKNPWREDRPLASLKGAAAGDVVRALCDFLPPYGIRALSSRANLALGTVARVVDLLERDATLDRNDRGVITRVNLSATIRRWARDYACLRANRTYLFLDPRGVSTAIAKLPGLELPVAVTGSLAASLWAPIAAPRLVTLYVQDAHAVADVLGLRRVETGGNVLLVEPRSPVAFARTRQVNGVTYAAPSQVAADLLTAPGRGPDEAEALLNWMLENEDDWRV